MAFLMIVSGKDSGRRLEIETDDTGIGRAADNKLLVDDAAVSGHHCALIREGKRFTIRDLDSTNGTRLNGLPVREARLKPKDMITVGEVEIQFDGDDVETLKAPPAQAGIAPTVRTAPAGTPSAFQARRDNRMAWYAALGLLVALALAALGWFLFSVFKS
jgi:predicted component of type VI protein secretion system